MKKKPYSNFQLSILIVIWCLEKYGIDTVMHTSQSGYNCSTHICFKQSIGMKSFRKTHNIPSRICYVCAQ